MGTNKRNAAAGKNREKGQTMQGQPKDGEWDDVDSEKRSAMERDANSLWKMERSIYAVSEMAR